MSNLIPSHSSKTWLLCINIIYTDLKQSSFLHALYIEKKYEVFLLSLCQGYNIKMK